MYLYIQISGPGLFSHLLTLCTLVLVLATLPFSLFFVVKVVQVCSIRRYLKYLNCKMYLSSPFVVKVVRIVSSRSGHQISAERPFTHALPLHFYSQRASSNIQTYRYSNILILEYYWDIFKYPLSICSLMVYLFNSPNIRTCLQNTFSYKTNCGSIFVTTRLICKTGGKIL